MHSNRKMSNERSCCCCIPLKIGVWIIATLSVCFSQCCGSGSGIASGFNGVPGTVSWSRKAKMTTKIEKKVNKLHFWKRWMFSLRAEGFFCSLDVLYGDLGISKLHFWSKKIKNKNTFLAVFFSSTFEFGHQNLESGLYPDLDPDPGDPESIEMLDLDLDPDLMNPDTQLWFPLFIKIVQLTIQL